MPMIGVSLIPLIVFKSLENPVLRAAAWWIFPLVLATICLSFVLFSRSPHTISIDDSGKIEFVGVLRRNVFFVSEMVKIGPPNHGSIEFRFRNGRVSVLHQFGNFHQLVLTVKNMNSGVEIIGC